MTESNQELANLFIQEATKSLREGTEKIQHCVKQLSQEQLWWRPHESMNSIANVLIHLDGNLTQWMINGIRGAEDVRDRPAEFADRSGASSDGLLQKLEQTIEQVAKVLNEQTALTLIERRRIQGFETSVTGAIWDSLPHFRGHVQEIIYVTRQLLGDDYEFFWTPTTAEEGAPQG